MSLKLDLGATPFKRSGLLSLSNKRYPSNNHLPIIAAGKAKKNFI